MAGYTTFTPIWGAWSGDTVGTNPTPVYQTTATVSLPLSVCVDGLCNSVITVGTDGYFQYTDSTTSKPEYVSAFSGQDPHLYIYSSSNGVFYRIAGTVGSRSLVLAWYAGTYNQGYEQEHFTITYFEGTGELQFKYYDIIQNGAQASAYVQISKPVHPKSDLDKSSADI